MINSHSSEFLLLFFLFEFNFIKSIKFNSFINFISFSNFIKIITTIQISNLKVDQVNNIVKWKVKNQSSKHYPTMNFPNHLSLSFRTSPKTTYQAEKASEWLSDWDPWTKHKHSEAIPIVSRLLTNATLSWFRSTFRLILLEMGKFSKIFVSTTFFHKKQSKTKSTPHWKSMYFK